MPGPTDLPADEPEDFDFEPDPGLFPGPGVELFECLRCDCPRPLERIYRLCRPCLGEIVGDPALEAEWLYPDRGRPEEPTDTTPGSAEREAVLRCRLLSNEDLFHPADSRREMTEAEVEGMKERLSELMSEPVQRPPGETGIERDGNKLRVRPMHGGKKANLGEFAQEDEEEAVQVVRAFWRQVLGTPADATPEQIAEARQAAADRSRRQAREKREQAELDAYRVELDAAADSLFPG